MAIYNLITRFVAEGDDATSVAQTVARSYVAVGNAASGATIALRTIGQNAGSTAAAIGQTTGALDAVTAAATTTTQASEALDAVGASARAATQSVTAMDYALDGLSIPGALPGLPTAPAGSPPRPVGTAANSLVSLTEATNQTRALDAALGQLTIPAALADASTSAERLSTGLIRATVAAQRLGAQAPAINAIGSAASAAAVQVEALAASQQPAVSPLSGQAAAIDAIGTAATSASSAVDQLAASERTAATSATALPPALNGASAAASELSAQAPGVAAVGTAAAGAAASVNALAGAERAAVSNAVSLPPILRQGAVAAQQLGNESRTAFGNIASGARSALGSVTSLIGAYVGFQAIKTAIGGAVAAQTDYETKVTGLAALINTNFTLDPDRNFAASLEEADNAMAMLAERARVLPGDLGDMVGAAQNIAGPMFGAGKGIRDLIDRASQVPIVAGIIGQSVADTGNQLSRMMSGMSGADVPLAMRLKSMGLLTQSFEELNALPTAQRVAAIGAAMDTLAADPDLFRRIVEGGAAQFATFRENLFGVTGLFGQVGDTVRDALLVHVREFNRQVERNPDMLRDIARIISGVIVPAIDTGARGLRWALDHAQGIATALQIAAVSYATIKAGGLVASVATPVIQATLSGGAGAAAGSGLLTMLGPTLAGVLRPAIADGMLVAVTSGGGIFGSLAGLSAGFSTLSAILAPVAAVLLPIIAIVAAIGATIAVAMDRTNAFGVMLTESFAYVGSAFGRLFNSLAPVGPAFGGIVTVLGSLVAGVLTPLVYVLGGIIDVVTGTVTVFTGIIASVAAFWGAIASAAEALIDGNLTAAKDILLGTPQIVVDAFAENWKATYGPDTKPGTLPPAELSKPEGRNPTDVRPKPTSVNIQNLNVTNNFDKSVSPDRVAFGLIDQLRQIRATRPVLKPMQGY
ncbi:hypothetical protein GC173_11485 [bacterium]|nr:hypothetical protein [bacterium]